MNDFRQTTIASLKNMTLDELGDYVAAQQIDHWTHSAGMAELARRQTISQLAADDAQIRAAKAEEKAAEAATRAADANIEAAHHAGRNAKYMLWSVIAAAISAFISLMSTFVTLYFTLHPPSRQTPDFTPFSCSTAWSRALFAERSSPSFNEFRAYPLEVELTKTRK
jgi:hypothetical protein